MASGAKVSIWKGANPWRAVFGLRLWKYYEGLGVNPQAVARAPDAAKVAQSLRLTYL